MKSQQLLKSQQCSEIKDSAPSARSKGFELFDNATVAKSKTRPTFQELRAYCVDRDNDVDPELFFNHYQANGWKVGKNAMKDWRAAVRTWERNGINSGNGKGRPNEGMGSFNPSAPATPEPPAEVPDPDCQRCRGAGTVPASAHPGKFLVCGCVRLVPRSASPQAEQRILGLRRSGSGRDEVA